MSFEASSLFDLTGAVAVITGGGTGIGLMTARTFAANGAKVYITGRRKAVLEQAVAKHGQGLKGQIVAIQGDVASRDDLKRMASEIKEGHIHILVNNAGVEGPVTVVEDAKNLSAQQLADKHLKNETFDDWDKLFRINVHAIFFATMSLLPLLAAGNANPPRGKQGWTGSVINVTSISGIVKTNQNHYAYNASKAAANSLTMMLAHELNFAANLKLRINALCPGLFPTEMTAATSNDGVTQEDDVKIRNNPAGRCGTSEEMGSAMLFLATNGFTTGQLLAIDGGYITAVPSAR